MISLFQTFLLNPNELNNIIKVVDNKIKVYCKNYCSEKFGCIVYYSHITSIKPLQLPLTSSKIPFKVSFLVEMMKPKIGENYVCKITNIFDKGVFVSYLDKFRIFIPIVYENTSKVEDLLFIKIINTRFQNNVIQCIGEIINDD
jgi:DNA-directed RNA polymerase subunit E'/Rpb7